MKKIILIFSILTIILCNNSFAQDINNDIDPNASKVKGTGVNTEAIFDILRNYNVDSLITIAQGYGVVWTGNYYIVSHFSANQLFKISANWTLIQGPITIANSTLPASQGFRDMEFARGFLWGVAAATTSNRIYKVDTATFTQVGVINLPTGISPRDLAWDPVRNGFWTSTSSFAGNLQCYDTNGVAISGALIPTVAGGFYGIAYDGVTAGGPYLWLAKDPIPTGPSITGLVRFNIAAAPIRLDSAVITIPLTTGAPLASGGLDFRSNLIPGKTTLIGLVQGTPDRVVVYEVGSTGPPPGGTITVSRNGIYKSIPENGGNNNPMLDTITVSGIPSGNVIKKISVKIDTVTHTWIGDLRFWLTHNTAVDTIISRIGWTGTGFGNSCDNFIGTYLIDSVGPINIQNIPSACVGGSQSQTTGTFNPKAPLNVFNNTGDPNGLYILRISDNAAGDTGALKAWSVTIEYGIPLGISNNTNLASEYKLSQNYPNPFNPSTKIDFSIPKSGHVTIKVFDIIGKEVATLINEYRNAGNHEITFNGSNLSSGMYFYRIEAGNFVQTKKMSLLK